MEEVCPDKAPLYRLTEWELGVLAGQRILIEDLKIKLKIADSDSSIGDK